MIESIRPLADRVLVRRTEGAKQSPGGIHIPETAQNKSTRGTVVAVGPGRRSTSAKTFRQGKDATVWEESAIDPMSVNVGDTILFSTYAGNEIESGGEKLLLMSESDVLAVIEPKEAKK